MALKLYLAMTGAEIRNSPAPPEHMAWMACHFSPYGTGISNVPPLLPPDSMLILNDLVPPQGHDPRDVARQLREAAEDLDAARVLLDFQRPGDPQTAAIAAAVIRELTCSVGISDLYAGNWGCPVFLTPALHRPLKDQLEVWNGREVWLEAALDCQEAVLTEEDCRFSPGVWSDEVAHCHEDNQLHCRYYIQTEDTCVRFTLWRGPAELQALLDEGENLGIGCAIGLYQQLGETRTDRSPSAQVPSQ